MGDERGKSTTSGSALSALETPELPDPWSAQRKTEPVHRLLRGDGLGAMSREPGPGPTSSRPGGGCSWIAGAAHDVGVASPCQRRSGAHGGADRRIDSSPCDPLAGG
jgi:hypothetical protein